MKKSLIKSLLVISLMGGIILSVLCMNHKKDYLFEGMVEALADDESELIAKCGDCSTEKRVYCCWFFFESIQTGYFFFRD